MLLPFLIILADVIAMFFIYIALPNMHFTVVEADVVCLVEDGNPLL